MAFERARRVDDAIASHRAALEVVTGDIGAMQALVRAQVWHGKEGAGTARLLRKVAVRGGHRGVEDVSAGAVGGMRRR